MYTFHQTQETCHNVPTHYCQSSPVENVVHHCKKVSHKILPMMIDAHFILAQVSDGPKKCEKVPVNKCSTVTSQRCRQVCA